MQTSRHERIWSTEVRMAEVKCIRGAFKGRGWEGSEAGTGANTEKQAESGVS